MNKTFGRSPLTLVRCLSIGICVLLISPALAQVNGPGPSPSSDFDIVLNLPDDVAVITGGSNENIGGVPGQTTQLNVSDGGDVGLGFEAGSGSEVNITGGNVGFLFDASSGSEVNISGGNVGGNFDAAAGSVVDISSGAVGSLFEAFSGSVVNISGGSVGTFFRALSGCEVTISGGGIGSNFGAFAGSDVELIGGEFRLNGAPYTGGSITLVEGNDDVFTGTLADGSALIFSSLTEDLINVTLTLANLPPVDTDPIVIDSPVVNGPSGLHGGQEATVVAGGSLGAGFAVVDATLNVEAGSVGDGMQLFNSELNVSDGLIGSSLAGYQGATTAGEFRAFSNSVVNISGGNVSNSSVSTGSQLNISGGTAGSFMARSGSEVNISGGTVVDQSRALVFSGYAFSDSVVNISGGNLDGILESSPGSEVNISGGTVAELFASSEVNIVGGSVNGFLASTGSEANISGGSVAFLSVFSGGVVNITGGTVDDTIRANEGSSVNIRGREFSIDGAPLSNLQPDQPFIVDDREVTLSGVLADGEPFSFSLSNSYGLGFFSSEATLTVTLADSFLLGDVNQDEEVSFADIPPFINLLISDSFLEEADINQDDEVNFSDIPGFIAILSAN